MSYWSESPASEAEWISLTLGSLKGEDLRDLEDLGLLEMDEERVEKVEEKGNVVGSEGLPWFETMVQGSKLGNMKKSWGSRSSGSGRYKVEWEIVEWTEGDDDNSTSAPPKRKLGEVLESDEADAAMEGVH